MASTQGSSSSQPLLAGLLWSLILFPFDLVRLTLRFAWMTMVLLAPHGTHGVPADKAAEARRYTCTARRLSRDGLRARCFVARRFTAPLLHLYCGCGDLWQDDRADASYPALTFPVPFRTYLRIVLCLGVTWAIMIGGTLLLWPASARLFTPQSPMVKFRQEADQFCRTGAFDRARIQYLNALQQNPSDIPALWGLASCDMKLGFTDEAASTLRKILARDPSHLAAHGALADLLLDQGNPDKALEHALLVASKAVHDTRALVRLGECYRRLGRHDAARQQAEQALKLDPAGYPALMLAAKAACGASNYPVARQHLESILAKVAPGKLDRLDISHVYRDCGDYAAAKAQLVQLPATNQAQLAIGRELAELAVATSNITEAIETYERLERDYSSDVLVKVRLAQLLLAVNRVDAAYERGELLVRAVPAEPAGHLILASAYYLKGLLSACASSCRICLQHDPKSTAARSLLARCLMRQNNHEEATPHLRALVKDDSQDFDSLMLLAECSIAQSHRQEARSALQQAITLRPGSEQPYLMMGRLYLSQDDPGKACEAYRSALELNPRHPVGLNNLAALLATSGNGITQDLPEAMKLATAAWSISPDNPDIADTLGWIHALKGNFTQAASLLAFASRQRPGDPMVRYHLAHALAGLKRYSEAMRELDMAIEQSPALLDIREIRSFRQQLKARQTGDH